MNLIAGTPKAVPAGIYHVQAVVTSGSFSIAAGSLDEDSGNYLAPIDIPDAAGSASSQFKLELSACELTLTAADSVVVLNRIQ